ncbi:MAG: HesB/IscA family protein [Verrucomicrobiota bacterium]
MISLTEAAAAHIKALQKAQANPESVLRVLVETGGCSGFEYGMAFDVRKDGDLEFESQGLKILIDPTSHAYLDGSTVHFDDGLHGKGFEVRNPNATSTCGCGKSFSEDHSHRSSSVLRSARRPRRRLLGRRREKARRPVRLRSCFPTHERIRSPDQGPPGARHARRRQGRRRQARARRQGREDRRRVGGHAHARPVFRHARQGHRASVLRHPAR